VALVDADEAAICEYLKTWPGQFVAGRQICRQAAGKWRFNDDPNWAIPILTSLVSKGILEADLRGHYRLLSAKRKHAPKESISPETEKIIEPGETVCDEPEQPENPSEPEGPVSV
jgi:hypothetical protein